MSTKRLQQLTLFETTMNNELTGELCTQAITAETREERGKAMAALVKITTSGDAWTVPSATGRGRYSVHLTPQFESCSCPDFELNGGRCKHIFAVEIIASREQNADGSITETVQITQTARRSVSAELATIQRSPDDRKSPLPVTARRVVLWHRRPRANKRKTATSSSRCRIRSRV